MITKAKRLEYKKHIEVNNVSIMKENETIKGRREEELGKIDRNDIKQVSDVYYNTQYKAISQPSFEGFMDYIAD